jgi:hypothetical protein
LALVHWGFYSTAQKRHYKDEHGKLFQLTFHPCRA